MTAYGGQQIVSVERLRQNLLGPGFSRSGDKGVCTDCIRLEGQGPETTASGDGDDTDSRIARTEAADELQTVHLGHDDVRHHNVEFVFFDGLQSTLRAGGRDDRKSSALEH